MITRYSCTFLEYIEEKLFSILFLEVILFNKKQNYILKSHGDSVSLFQGIVKEYLTRIPLQNSKDVFANGIIHFIRIKHFPKN